MSKTIEEVLRNLVNQKDIADVKFLVGHKEEEMYGHKVLLSTASEYWMRMFYGLKWKEISESKNEDFIVIRIPDVEPNAFLVLLDYAYTRNPKTLTGDNAIEVLMAADKYMLDDLQVLCSTFIKDNIIEDNCLLIFEIFDSLKLVGFEKDELQRFIEVHSDNVFNEKCFRDLKRETIQNILNFPNIQTPEITLFKALIDWAHSFNHLINIDISTIKNTIGDLIDLIHFDLMRQDEIDFVNQSGLVNEKLVVNPSRILCRGSRKIKKSESDIKVLIVSTETRQDHLNDLIQTIKTSEIQTVEVWDATKKTPLVSHLLQYDAIFLICYSKIKDSINLGIKLAEYVQKGGGLVVSALDALVQPSLTFKNEAEIKGKIIDEDFLGISKGKRFAGIKHKLGKIEHEKHPIVNGVSNLDGGDVSYQINTKVSSDTKVIATWDNGLPLVTEKRIKFSYGSVVTLNFYPISSKVRSNYWDALSTDGLQLVSNCVKYVALN
eukprot:Anaeramoba_ignava/c19484_g3_i1.p1 GENE.c19484_g3_i1~~c19484_g3_i1.p1  ORF type:complete len:492 (+),score=126.43 c19484_g3_i1:43-1518(+)